MSKPVLLILTLIAVFAAWRLAPRSCSAVPTAVPSPVFQITPLPRRLSLRQRLFQADNRATTAPASSSAAAASSSAHQAAVPRI